MRKTDKPDSTSSHPIIPPPTHSASLSPCHPRIFLIGYRGTGKTTTARALAERLDWAWCDADQILEERYQTTIRDIFQAEGETGFRDKETTILAELAQRTECVIATGGGVVLRPENRAQLKLGLTIWLTAPPDVIWQRLQDDATSAVRRPNLTQGGRAEVEELLRIRQPLYQACANLTLDTAAKTAQQITDEIAAWLHAHGGVDIL